MSAANPPVIVLVRPQLGENIGKAARAMLNFGLTQLRLVAPRDGWPNPDAGPAAAGADIVLERAQTFESLADAVADNNSSGVYVTGGIARRAADVDLPLEACLLEIDGHVVDSATGSAVLGNPAEALAFAANTLATRGHAIEAGWIVLTGGMTDAVAVERGARVAAHFTTLGSITLAGG